MKTIVAFSRSILILLNTSQLMLRLWVISLVKGESDQLGFRFRGKWADSSQRILGIKLDELTGSMSSQPALYVSNHRAMVDPLIQCSFIHAFIIAKDEVGGIPIIGKGAEMTGIVLVKRDKMSSRIATKNKTEELLRSGKNVLVYAEGTTVTSKTTGTFKAGTFAVAAELNIPVVPIAIEYQMPKDMWEDQSMRQHMVDQVGSWRTRAKVRIGSEIFNTDAKTLMAETRIWIDRNLQEMQSDWSQVH